MNTNIQKINRVEGLDENSKKLIINDNPFKIKLKSHQETLLYKVLEIDNLNSGKNMPFGIMSDKPGSGKTFVVLAMIYYSIKFFDSKGVNIIVVPHNIYSQWIDAIDKFLGNLLKYKCLIEYKEINILYSNASLLNEFDIIITTPILYDIFASTLNGIGANVTRVFFDEADTIKNLLVNLIKANMTWFISATFYSVFDQNTMKAKIGAYDLYLPNLLQNECYCKLQYIDSNIKLPKPNMEVFTCKDFYLDYILVNILDKEQIKFINGHDYFNIRNECDGHQIKNSKEILKYLLINCNKKIIDCDAVLKELLKNKVDAMEIRSKTEKKKNHYMQRLEQIKFLCKKYYLCIECFINIDEVGYKSICEDYLCENCINKTNIICLTCNKNHKTDTLIEEKVRVDKKIKEYISKKNIDKFVILNKVLEVCGEKILLYSEFRGLNNYLKNLSIEKNFIYEELNGGNIKEIDKILKGFKENPEIKILYIDNSYFGVGLNIEYTTDIIFFHNTEINIKNQLIGRAQRYGRKDKLNIWEIKYANE